MSLLSLSEVSFGYACGTLLFEGVTFSINPDDRVALVGPNGTGKSTLLRLIAGQLEPSRGEITRRRGLTVAIAGQDFAAPSGQKLFDFAFQFSPSLLLLRTQIRALEDHLSH